MVPFATLPLVDTFRLRSQRGPAPGLLSIWTQKSPAARSSSSASWCSDAAISPPSQLVRFCACSVTNAFRLHRMKWYRHHMDVVNVLLWLGARGVTSVQTLITLGPFAG